ncbi:MAG: hypothetical protein BGO10_10540 [Chlamydia sp. 32-24]|nr:MAG: hypothetical protein BGO10_10540 [Chlamydia sp. 32-24]
MPTYEYICQNCYHSQELFHKINENPSINCPSCQSNLMKRGPGGGIGIALKGTGFYETDYVKKQSQCCPCGKDSMNCS